ncbi:MAG: helix-turn-helix domain-containing protein [Prevotella sp.]
MKDRIRLVMENQHQTQKVFANFIGMSEGALSSIFTGRTKPTLNIVEAIKNKIPKISTDWLLFGKGEMFEQVTPAPQTPSESSPSPAPDEGEPVSQGQPSAQTKVVEPSFFAPSQAPRQQPKEVVKIVEKKPRRITEIRVFYDDQTWETFVPQKI